MFGFNLDMPKKKNLIMSLAFLTASLFVFVTQAAKDDFSVLDNYVFTDNPAKIKVQGKMKSIRYRVRTVTRSGWGPESEGEADVVDSLVEINPMTEGIHIVTFPGTVSPEVRFLAITPPVKLDQTRVEKILTQKGKKLFSNQSFRIVSMGDSVTHTGDYESMLVMLLESATGNKNISFVDRSYPGRSADATVREFQKDAVENRPDLGLVMYGLNDQACGVPLPTYLDQYAWLARQLRLQCGSDCIFMQPTPVFYISVFGIVNLDAYDPWSIFR
ncbi:MAG: hypothetical protein JW884_02990, partial [Deltaproteobacteria bacterium]|nr:hypothetical protein [Deltaproteobacteria bacterium]